MLLKDLFQKVEETFTLNKSTENDKRSILANSISSWFNIDGKRAYSYLYDYDDSYVYFEIYGYDSGTYHYWKSDYSYDGTKATFGETAVEVVRTTEWKEVSVEDELEKSLTSKIVNVLEKYFGGSGKQPNKELPVIKQFQDEEMVSIEPLYIKVGDVDGVGDTYYSDEDCYKMVDSLNKAIKEDSISGNYFHKVMTDDFSIEKAWVNECDCMIGDTLVEEGQPLIKLRFVNEDAWELRKSGDLMGVSIGAQCEEIVELGDE